MNIAVYTRKSIYTENSESIDTQIKLCKEYFRNKNNEFEIFEDEGFSGKNTKRPAFQRMMKLIKLNKYDALICYRLDRISRNVLDFSTTLETLNKYNVSFISLSEQFDTSTPMGRAMVYISSVFAQLERETIAERVKDSMLELAKKGCWTGGPAPGGYQIIKEDGKSYLKLNNKEFIKDCFETYLKVQSLYGTHKILKEKYSETPNQRENLRRILRSPMYVKSNLLVSQYLKLNNWKIEGKENSKGYLCYGVTKGDAMAIVSRHEAIIEHITWLNVQTLLDSKRESFFKKESKNYWLSSILKCPFCGADYVIANSSGNTYYVCGNRLRRLNKAVERCSNSKYVKAEYIENEIENYLDNIKTKEDFIKECNVLDNPLNIGFKTLEKEWATNTRKIKNLAEQLEDMTKEASKPLRNRIEELTSKNIKLTNEIQEIKLRALEDRPKENNTFSNIDSFKNTKTNMDKRIIVKNIFKSITYNPLTDHSDIVFI
ncbi:recombinase family protein [Clostridium estertheticum]|uniref:recombinase family protein n=1 Tax=Clostridium estertheticum TaxID=238834 RepID=UPI0013EE7EE7|nr:recombinase family protein [Clostridium estertheticum]MBZ9608677.1 recombinase family protein [Clostridium estertheticum]